MIGLKETKVRCIRKPLGFQLIYNFLQCWMVQIVFTGFSVHGSNEYGKATQIRNIFQSTEVYGKSLRKYRVSGIPNEMRIARMLLLSLAKNHLGFNISQFHEFPDALAFLRSSSMERYLYSRQKKINYTN